VGIVPPEVSLTDEVKAMCGRDVLEGCRQWHAFFSALSADMYENAEAYAPASARQYRDILEKIAAGGVLRNVKAGKDATGEYSRDEAAGAEPAGGVLGAECVDGGIEWDAGEWKTYRDRVDRSKQYVAQGVTLDACLEVLARMGLTYGLNGRGAIFGFRNPAYAKIFYAMQAFELSPRVRETPARHHFAHCEFRQLFRSYNANHDELMRRASDESLYIVREIHEYCKSLALQRYIHFGIIKYKHKGVRVLDYNLYGNEYPTLRINIGPYRINPFRGDLDEILRRIADRKDMIDANLHASVAHI
jgi:hypothetical protein